MELKVKEWKVVAGKVCGRYGVFNGEKEIASQAFNEGFGSEEISMPKEVLDKAKELDELVNEAIKNNF